jgi:AcrR family transcriptional regulator
MSMAIDIDTYSMSTVMDMNSARTYTMTNRAASAAATRRRVIEATISLAAERRFAEITLEAVATRAEVSVRTVLRHFVSREGLMSACMEAAMADIEAERRTPAGDVTAAVRTVVDHYEARGRTALLLLAQEDEDEFARTAAAAGKAMHRDWVRDAFAPATTDETLLDLLVVATDVYAWKLLRLDRGLSREETETRLRALVRALLPEEG